MENGDAPPPPTCPHCGCRDNKPKYNNNKKPDQLRVECQNCRKLFQRSPIRKVHPEGYKKEKVEEPMRYQIMIKQCDACKSTDAKFYSLNNNDPLQARYKCKNPNCKKVFTPFKKSQLLNQKPAQLTTGSDTDAEINSLRMSTRDFYYNPFSSANEILDAWGRDSGYFLPSTVDNNGPDTSYSSAPNGAGCSVQTATASLYNAPDNRAYNSIATHNNTSGEACGLGQNTQNIYEDPNTYNTGISTHDHYGEGGGSRVYQRDIPNLPPTRPPYPTYNNLPDSTNIHNNAPTSSSSTLYHASSSTNVPQTLQDHEYNMQLNSGRTYNVRYVALRQPPQNMFSGSIYRALEGVMHEGYANNNIDSQSNNPQQLGNGGPIRRNRRDTPPFNRSPYK